VEPSLVAPSIAPAPAPSASVISPEPAAPAAEPARITIPGNGFVSFLPGDAQQLQVMDLTGRLLPGNNVNLVFEFSNGAPPLTLQAPMAIPLSPASRAPGVDAGLHGSDQGTGEGENASENDAESGIGN
jgi:hypothetical protein